MSPFEALRHKDERGDYWLARGMVSPLGYAAWQRFREAIARGRAAIELNGGIPDSEISEVAKIVKNARGESRKQQDFRLTIMGAYAVIQGADPSKAEVAEAWGYFRTRVRQAELAELSAPSGREIAVPTPVHPLELVRVQLDYLIKHESRLGMAEDGLLNHKHHLEIHQAQIASIQHNNGMQTILGFSKLYRVEPPLSDGKMSALGRAAAKKYREAYKQGPPQTKDQRYGYVGMYPEHIIQAVITEAGYTITERT